MLPTQIQDFDVLLVRYFLRKHAHRLISFDVFHYSRNLNESELEDSQHIIVVYCKQGKIVRITDAKIWFKIIRNFGSSIKYIRIQGFHHERDTSILSALQNLNKYIFEFCSDSLVALELRGYPFFTLNKPLTKLQEFFFVNDSFENSETLELMPNLRTLMLRCIPRKLKKHYPKLERVELQLDKDEEVHSIIPFLRMNRQIKYLKLCLMMFECKEEHNDLIYTSIAENLTQLKTLKLEVLHQWRVTFPHCFKTVETFSVAARYAQVLSHLSFLISENLRYRKPTIQRSKKLKILKLYDLSSKKLLKESDIRKLLNELPELEQINIQSSQKEDYSTLKNILGSEWEQIEIKFRFSLSEDAIYHRFKKKCQLIIKWTHLMQRNIMKIDMIFINFTGEKLKHVLTKSNMEKNYRTVKCYNQ